MRFYGFLAGLALTIPLPAQTDPYFPKPSYFRKHFSNVSTHVELQPPVRLNDFVMGGTLELSLRNFLELVMATVREFMTVRCMPLGSSAIRLEARIK